MSYRSHSKGVVLYYTIVVLLLNDKKKGIYVVLRQNSSWLCLLWDRYTVSLLLESKMAVSLGVAAAFVIMAAIFSYYAAKQLRIWYLVEKIPGPPAIPILGNSHRVNTEPGGMSAYLLYCFKAEFCVISYNHLRYYETFCKRSRCPIIFVYRMLLKWKEYTLKCLELNGFQLLQETRNYIMQPSLSYLFKASFRRFSSTYRVCIFFNHWTLHYCYEFNDSILCQRILSFKITLTSAFLYKKAPQCFASVFFFFLLYL